MIEWDSPDKFIGTTAALILAGTAAASAGSQIYGAKKAANAARQAGQIQADASNRAADLQAQAQQESLAFLRDESQYNRQQQAPYRAIGKGAISTLSNLTGVPMDYSGQDYPSSSQTSQPGKGLTLGNMGQPSTQPVARMPMSPQGGGGMVTVRAPTGQTGQIPQDQLQRALQMGATVVG